MATITQNEDGTLTVTLSEVEQDILSGLDENEFANYITMWLQGRAQKVFQDRFARLTPEDRTEIMRKLRETQGPRVPRGADLDPPIINLPPPTGLR